MKIQQIKLRCAACDEVRFQKVEVLDEDTTLIRSR